jgi:hypothetical protein
MLLGSAAGADGLRILPFCRWQLVVSTPASTAARHSKRHKTAAAHTTQHATQLTPNPNPVPLSTDRSGVMPPVLPEFMSIAATPVLNCF